MDWLNALAGLLVGTVVGLTGVGGGSLMSPLLILFFGIAPATAIGTDLWFAAITKSVGGFVHHRNSTVEFSIVGLLAIGSIPAALLTGLWLWHLGLDRMGSGGGAHPLTFGLGIVLILTSLATVFRLRLARAARALSIRSNPSFPTFKRAATITAGAILVSAACATAIQLWFRVQARRSQFRRRQTSSRLATFAEAFSSIGWAASAALLLAIPIAGLISGLITASLVAATWKFSPRRD